MSNDHAIAATTRTLQNLLTGATPTVTTLPLDKARDGTAADQLNLFLFATPLAAAWRNSDPIGLRPGETGQSPLPLVLHYLVTAYGDNETAAHLILGRAMRILHDHPVLAAQEITDATADDLPDSDLHLQPERIRLTPLPMSTHDMFELWSGFSTNYRISAAYEASVILVDSTQAARTPLPVLRRGPDDRGPSTAAAAPAELTAVLPPDGAAVATLGANVRLVGSNLTGAVTAVRFRNRWLDAPIELAPTSEKAPEPTVALPSGDPANVEWVPGIYQVSVVSAPVGLSRWASGEVPMALGAAITVSPLNAPAGDVALTLECRPRLRSGQRVLVLFGAARATAEEIRTPDDTTEPTTVTVTFRTVPAGSHVVRLRVDGVDSDPVRYDGTPPQPRFDPAVVVTVT
ncbi:DUF4255 domain-containing protein [Rhodococcus aetherivorans]|uniref:DUF4255 domain-containing protein n=1 Tax=Rhodococcus aetherivorans TaxID=191292 RepID=UPI00366F29E7